MPRQCHTNAVMTVQVARISDTSGQTPNAVLRASLQEFHGDPEAPEVLTTFQVARISDTGGQSPKAVVPASLLEVHGDLVVPVVQTCSNREDEV